MKKRSLGKNTLIRYESELHQYFQELVRNDPDLEWEITGADPKAIELTLDGRRIPFKAIYELKFGLPQIENLNPNGNENILLVTPEVSPRIVEAAKRQQVSVIDLNGRTWIRASGLLIDRKGLPQRSFSYELEPRNIFVGKSARISRCLLTDLDHVWTQREIVVRTGASSGLVSRIVKHLVNQGYLEKLSAREFRLCDAEALLNDWAASDRLGNRASTSYFAGFIKPPQEFARDLKDWAMTNGVPIIFTQWVAAWARHPFTEPAVCSAYIPRIPDAASLEKLGLRHVSDGGKLWLHVPDDEGIFSERRIANNELPVVSDAQIFLDLQQTGLRGPEAANALREWEGFCKRASGPCLKKTHQNPGHSRRKPIHHYDPKRPQKR